MGDAFKAKKPEEIKHLSNESKLSVVRLLTKENGDRLEVR